MTTFEDGKARNLALRSGGTIIDNLDGTSVFGYKPEYSYFNINAFSFDETVRVTISFDLVMTVAKANPSLTVYNSNRIGPMGLGSVNALAGETHAVGETIEKRVAVTMDWFPRQTPSMQNNFVEFYSVYDSGNYYSISNLMVELGEVAHPWRAAPEDSGAVSDMIIATDSCTLAVTVDVQKVETYYYQTASTASAPSKPTTATPSGWQTTEFAFDVTKAVWTCQKTTLTDGTWHWGEVSKSSAYEGAVVSKNAADAAQSTANSANAREQRIYKSAASGTTSMAATETWVASAADVQGAWTAKRPSYDRSYPVLFTATQRQTVAQQAAGFACSCTVPYVDESAAVAGNYITKVSTGGDAWVHSEDHGPDANGNATTNTYGWRIGSVFELVRAGLSYLKMWVDNSVAKVRVGLESAGHSVFSPGGMEVFTDAVTSVASFGSATRIGKAYVSGASDNESHMELDYHSLQLVDKEGNAYLYVSDLRGPDGSMLVECESELTYVQALNAASMDLPLPLTTYQTSIITENIVSVVAHTPSGDVDITNYVNASSSSATELVFNSLPTLGTFTRATATATYHTSDRRVKALTYGSRKTPEDIGACSSVLGWENDASGLFSHAHGNGCVASGVASNAEGGETEAVADYSHAEGRSTTASGYSAHAEGSSTTASGNSAHAEGLSTQATASQAHAEGRATVARGLAAHAEGNGCEALDYAHAEGMDTVAMGPASHAQGWHTHAKRQAQTAIGTFNVIDTSAPEDTTHPAGIGRGDEYNMGQYALIIGNGTADNARSNALAVDWNGNVMAQAMAGIIQMFAGATPPSGWLVCDGSAVSRNTYSTLFAAIGTTWGAGDGSTTFNLPDLRGRAPIGAGTGSGLTARTLGTQNIGSENVQAHTHSISRTTNVAVSDSGHTHPAATSGYYYAIGSATFAKQSGTAQSGSSGLTNAVRQSGTVSSNKNTGSGHASLSVTQPVFSVGAVSGATTGTAGNMQPSAVVNFIICTGKTS